MNIAIYSACSHASDAKKGKIEIRPDIPFVQESTVEAERTDKNTDKFVSVTCKYMHKAGSCGKSMYFPLSFSISFV